MMDRKQAKGSSDFFGTFLTKKGPAINRAADPDMDFNIEKNVLDALAHSDGGMDIKSLIMQLSTSASTTIMTLNKMEEAGLLKIQDSGSGELAVLTEMGEKLAS
ncbi:MarR family transcriptional regulator [Parasphingorhabdus sp.]|jgi:predicted transcriptional regulator|uniref:MarR family transcriptional regulator n=1 Tax=Parasphingorhabdus sp. TaxID=2709688 RepID=UPI0007F5299E|nr:hypothetical protein A8B75_00545 [Sphingomonadales bacterium EhC05]